MSPDPYPLFSASESDNSEKIKDRIALLIKLYAKHPESMLAEAVVQHIVVILAKPDGIREIEQRCLFRQLEMHWRSLVWINRFSDQQPMRVVRYRALKKEGVA